MTFHPGATYRFDYVRKRPIIKNGDGDARRVTKYTFMREAQGAGVTLYMFRHALAGYRESFTPCQLGDHIITKETRK